MASNELAAILARRRAKAGGESEPPVPAVGQSASSASETVPAAARSSIAERIARLKQQSAAANAPGAAAPTPSAPRFNPPAPASEPSEVLQASSSSVGSSSDVSVASEPIDTSAVAAAQEAAGIRKASSKIQQLQGSLGINVNPFGRPGASSSGGYRSGQRESIMSTGEEQYGHTQHAMGVAMPGMTGSAIPMPGLAKGGFRLPGMAAGGEPSAEASAAALDDSHATMNRVAGPKRRGPARPPPGAFRIPTMAAPIIDNVEPVQVSTTEPVGNVITSPTEVAEPKAQEAPVLVSPPAPEPVNLFGNPAPAPVCTPSPVQSHTPAPTPVSAPAPAAPTVAATLHKLPEPEVMPPMKPYHIEDDDPYAPKYDAPAEQYSYAPAGFPSALMANFSMDELSIDDKTKSVASSTPSSTSASSLFGGSSTPAPVSEPTPKPTLPPPVAPVEPPKPAPAAVFTPAPTPVPERVPSPTPVTMSAPVEITTPPPAPVTVAPTGSIAPSPVVSTPVPPPAAPAPTPVVAPTSVSAPAQTSGSFLFGATAASGVDDDDSSESDWSDDDNGGNQSLFGAPSAAPKPAAAAPTPVLVTPSQPTPELHEAPAPMNGGLFGPPSSSPAPGFVQATPQPAAIPPAPYSSLFSGAVSSSESESDSDDEGGLFGTGVPSKR